MRTRVLTGGGALLGAAAVALGPPASDATAQAPGKPLGFALKAVGSPSFFKLEGKPGETLRARVRLQSTSRRDRTVLLTGADARTAAAGGLDFGQYGETRSSRGTSRWLELSRSRVRLPAGGVVDVPFSVRVPTSARSGEHFAGVVAFQRPPQAKDGGPKFQLRFVSRVAVTVQVTVPGPRRPALELKDKRVAIAPTGASLALDLRNSGNTLIPKTTGRVTVRQKGRDLFNRSVQIDAFVPDTGVTYTVPWKGVPVEGEYEVEGFLEPEGAAPLSLNGTVKFGRERIREFEQETGRPAIEGGGPPIALIAGLAAAVVALALLAIAYVRLRRRL